MPHTDPMIRVEITRRLDCKQGRRRTNRVNPCSVIHCSTEAEVLTELATTRKAADEIAPGYMPMTEARLYDMAEFSQWVSTGGVMPVPFRVLTEIEINAL